MCFGKPPTMNRQNLIKAAAIFLVAAACLTLYLALVHFTGFMPRCLFKWTTGWDCPGCGSQRAFMALLHGHPAEACGYNLILIPTILYLLLLAIGKLWEENPRCGRMYRALTHPGALLAIVVILIAWTVVRNLAGI